MAAPIALRQRVAEARIARLATLRPDGSPHLVPFCFALDGDVIYSAVDAKPKRGGRLARFQNIERDPRVCVLVDHWSEDWSRLWWVRIDGQAAEVKPGSDTERRALGLLGAKYEQYRANPPPGPVLAVKAERWAGWSAG